MSETHASGDPTAIYAVAIAVVLGAVLIAGAVFMAIGALNQTIGEKSFTATVTGGTQQQQPAQPTQPTQPAKPAAPGAPRTVSLDLSSRPVDGNKNAKVTLVEFSEFLCPYCIRSYPVVSDLQSKYGDKMNLVHMNYIIHGAPAKLISEAVECAGDQGKYYEMFDKAFAAQGSGLDEAGLVSMAGNLSLDSAKFKECLDGGSKSAVIDAQQAQGSAVGVGGTPSFVILMNSLDESKVGKLQGVASSLVSSYGTEANVVKVPGRGYGVFFVGALPEGAFQQVIDAETG